MHGSGNTSTSLKDRTAITYGAGGAVGSAVARGFAEEGARVFLTGRNLDSVGKVASAIAAEGGVAESAQVDALDEQAVEKHASAVVRKAGRSTSRSMPVASRNRVFRESHLPSCRSRPSLSRSRHTRGLIS